MHLNTKTKLKDYHQCLWSNLLHYGCPSRCQTNIFFISNKEIIQKDTQRFRKIFNVFYIRFHYIRRRVAIIVAIQFFDTIFDDLGCNFNNAALLLFLCQLPLRLKRKHRLRHDCRLESCLKKGFCSYIHWFTGNIIFCWSE